MTKARGELLPGWRAGLLVLGLYAMLAQAFFASLAGPAHIAFAGPDGAVLCVSSADSASSEREQTPAKPHTGHDCVCAALCHGGHVPVPALAAGIVILRLATAGAPAVLDQLAFSAFPRVLPPARGPPHAGFVLSS